MSENSHNKTAERYQKYVMQTYAPKLALVKGQGSYVWDSEGRQYLDFAAGISVCNLGHCHPAVSEAIKQQVDRLVHVSNLYMNEVQPLLGEKLVKAGFDGVVFFANSGAEANEGLIKLARKWGSEKGKYEVISMADSFHGRTLATLAATGRSKYRKGFAPDTPGFVQVPFNDIKALEAAITDKTAAVLLEPVQGEGGIIPADPAYLKAVRELCTKKGVMLMFDEVQCGIGRTGTFYAFQGYGIEPDALSMAKALGNGFPLAAFMAKREFAQVLTPGTHASTFGGTPLACAAGCAVLDTIVKEKVLENCVRQGTYLQEKLLELAKKYKFMKEVRGKGLMIGVVMDCEVAKMMAEMMNNGLITLSCGENVLRLLPPLTVSKEEIDQAIAIMDKSFAASGS
ncbi:MAG: aspartate aminotransferase family protein [Victivallaceae bacterium]